MLIYFEQIQELQEISYILFSIDERMLPLPIILERKDTQAFLANSRITGILLYSYSYSSVRHHYSPAKSLEGIDPHVFSANSRITRILMYFSFQ